MSLCYNKLMKKSNVPKKLPEKPLRVCIACRMPVSEVKYGKKVIVCANKACPRFGLLTVVFAQLKKKHEIKESEHADVQP